MSRAASVLALASIVLAWAASAQENRSTACFGGKCYFSEKGGYRVMTDQEEREQRRENSRNGLKNVECALANDRQACYRALAELMLQFK